MKRLVTGYNVTGDCVVSNRFPLAESDPPGVFLGLDSVGKDVYITYWTALDIAQLVGYPPLEVVEATQMAVDELAEDLDHMRQNVETLAAESVQADYIAMLKEAKDDLLEEYKRTALGLRNANKFASDPDSSRTAKLGGGEGSSKSTRGEDSRNAPSEPTRTSADG